MAVQSATEREWKLEVPLRFVVPDVTDLLPDVAPGGRVEQSVEHLRSEYFDTATFDVFRAGMTLRRRSGTSDTGWHLKVPQEPFREELRLPLADGVSAEGVPEELGALLTGVVRGRPLRRVATLTTQRTVTRMLDAAGELVIEIDDDMVNASAAGPSATASTWREVEIELGSGPESLLDHLGSRLRDAGARRSSYPSKLARALPDDATAPSARPGEPIAAYLEEQLRVLLAGDLALRRDNRAVVHKTRVAIRRMRSTLRTFCDRDDAARRLDDELRWIAGLLGEVRDRQVLRRRLLDMLADLEPELQLGPVQARITVELQGEEAAAWDRVQQEIIGPRYLDAVDAVVRRVDAVLAAPALPKAQIRPAVHRAERRVRRRLKSAAAHGNGGPELHRARKAAKRARYAAEAAASVLGKKKAARKIDTYTALQELLGEHQDSVISAEVLRRLGATAGTTAGENGFTFGVMHERELARAADARRKLSVVGRAKSDRRLSVSPGAS